MQQPYSGPGGYAPPRRSALPLILGIGCGGCAILCVALVAGLAFLGRGIMREATKVGKPPPPAYVGVWTTKDGQDLMIQSNGRGSYHTNIGPSHQKIVNGIVEIDGVKRTLKVGFFGIGPTMRIDKPPHPARGSMEMTLDGSTYRRTSAPAKPVSGASDDSGDD